MHTTPVLMSAGILCLLLGGAVALRLRAFFATRRAALELLEALFDREVERIVVAGKGRRSGARITIEGRGWKCGWTAGSPARTGSLLLPPAVACATPAAVFKAVRLAQTYGRELKGIRLTEIPQADAAGRRILLLPA